MKVQVDDIYVVEGYASTWGNEYPVFDYLDDLGFVELRKETLI